MQRLGAVTEGAVMSALLKQGHVVLVPFGDDQPYDLVVHDAAGRFVRVQCKTGRVRGERVLFNSCSTDHGDGRKDYVGRADVFGVWCPELDRVFIVPVEICPGFVTTLRLRPPRNGQAKGIRYADDYGAERWLVPDALAA